MMINSIQGFSNNSDNYQSTTHSDLIANSNMQYFYSQLINQINQEPRKTEEAHRRDQEILGLDQ